VHFLLRLYELLHILSAYAKLESVLALFSSGSSCKGRTWHTLRGGHFNVLGRKNLVLFLVFFSFSFPLAYEFVNLYFYTTCHHDFLFPIWRVYQPLKSTIFVSIFLNLSIYISICDTICKNLSTQLVALSISSP
jgi:hypothetical protein